MKEEWFEGKELKMLVMLTIFVLFADFVFVKEFIMVDVCYSMPHPVNICPRLYNATGTLIFISVFFFILILALISEKEVKP